MEPIEIAVFGKPQPAGSKRSLPVYVKGGKPLIKNGRVIVNTVDDNKHAKGWKQEVTAAAMSVYHGDLIEGPVRLTITCFMSRPKGHYRTGKNAHLIRDGAPDWFGHTTKPDVLKLTRGIEDALTGVIWKDDSQVVQESLQKCYGTPQGVIIRIEPYEPTTAELEFGSDIFTRSLKVTEDKRDAA